MNLAMCVVWRATTLVVQAVEAVDAYSHRNAWLLLVHSLDSIDIAHAFPLKLQSDVILFSSLCWYTRIICTFLLYFATEWRYRALFYNDTVLCFLARCFTTTQCVFPLTQRAVLLQYNALFTYCSIHVRRPDDAGADSGRRSQHTQPLFW